MSSIDAESHSRKDWSRWLQTQLLPSIERSPLLQRPAPLVVAHPGLAQGAANVVPQSAGLLRSSPANRAWPQTAHWVEEGFNAPRYPTVLFVLEGEADFRLGVTRRMTQHDKSLSPKHGSYAVELETHSFFLVPAGAPISDASRPHWERPHLERASSRLLWFHVVPAGVTLHSCTTRGEEHNSGRSLFLSDTRLLPLVESVLEELQGGSVHSDALSRHYLAAMLLQIDRGLSASRLPVDEQNAPLREQPAETIATMPVERACQFIERRLANKITLTGLAAQAYVSPAHLCRLFKSELNTTPGAYIANRRLEQARSLLETTDLPIQRVSVLSGFPNPQHFSHAFKRFAGMSPGEFRRRRT